jgi:Concanavalin A-like lectin/glucanases superfamily
MKVLFSLLILLLLSSTSQAQQLAFPTAEGFGRFASGGRGGHAYLINSLSADSGTGGSCNAGGCGGSAPFAAGTVTFRDCLQDRFGVGPRTCIFRVGGQIDFTYCARCFTMAPFITIAGQTAPGNGILLRNFEMGVYSDVNSQHDVIVRHIRIRNHNYNDTSRCNNELVSVVFNSYNVIADHISGGWNFRSAYSAAYGIKGVTFQWMLLSEGTTAAPACSNDPSPVPVSLGGLSTLGADQNNGVSYLHGYISGYGDRIPVNSSTLTIQVVNQVAYNTFAGGWVQTSTTAGSNQPPFAEYINNYYQPGPGGLDANEPRLFLGAGLTNQPPTDSWAQQSQIYLSGNIHTTLRPTLTQPESDFALQYDWGDPAHAVPLNITTTRYAAMPALPSLVSAAQARQDVFDRKYGAYGKLSQGYDTIDARAVRALQNSSGGSTTATSTATACSDGECGETGSYPIGTPPVDTDGDGIPDSWETAHGLDLNNPADGPVIAANGYSNLENYLNELAGDTGPIPPPAGPPRIWLTFEECAGTTLHDETANGNTGDLLTAPTVPTFVPGRLGTCGLHFTAQNDTVRLNIGQIAPPLTIAFSIKADDAITGANHTLPVFPFLGAGGNEISFVWDSTNVGFRQSWLVARANVYTPCPYVSALSSATWYRLLLRLDGTTMQTYLNGALECTASTLGPSGLNRGSWLAPPSTVTGNSLWRGILDEVIIDNTAWDQSQITSDYNRTFNPPLEGPLGR